MQYFAKRQTELKPKVTDKVSSKEPAQYIVLGVFVVTSSQLLSV